MRKCGYVKSGPSEQQTADRLLDILMSQDTNHDDNAKGVGELLKEAASAIKMRRFDEAEDYCVQALGVLDKASATEHPSKAMALEFMGDALTGSERYEDAANFYKRAMDLSERIFTQENQVYIAIVYKLARTYESLSLLDECEPFYKSADELAKRFLSWDHPLRETIADGYAHLISRSKKRKEKVSAIMDSFRAGKGHADRAALEAQEASEEGGGDEDDAAAGARNEAHAATAYKDLRNKSTVYEHSAESMQWWINIILLLVVGCIIYLGYQHVYKPAPSTQPQSGRPPAPPEQAEQVEKSSVEPAASASAAASSSDDGLAIVKTYSSLDGNRKLKMGNANDGTVEFGKEKLKALIFKGADAWKADSEPGAKDAIKLTYTEMPGGVVDAAGYVLYAEDSPEMEVRTAMQAVAKSLRHAFLLRGSFPQNAEELNELQVNYRNPITGKTETPIIQIYRGDGGWMPSNPEEKSTFETSFEAGNLWTNEPPFLPGALHVFLMAGAPSSEPGAASDRVSVAIIKGADRSGTPVKLDKEKAFLIVLTPKSERTSVSSIPLPDKASGSQKALITITSKK